MSERQTWYVLVDGTCGDPREIGAGADGVLRHKDGRAVAYSPHGPRSRSVDVEAMKVKAVAARSLTSTDDKPASDDRQMKPAVTGKGYRTRGAKAD